MSDEFTTQLAKWMCGSEDANERVFRAKMITSMINDPKKGLMDAVMYFDKHGIPENDLWLYGIGGWTWPMFFDHAERAYKHNEEQENENE